MKDQENSKRRALGMGLEQLFNSEMLDFDQVEKETIIIPKYDGVYKFEYATEIED